MSEQELSVERRLKRFLAQRRRDVCEAVGIARYSKLAADGIDDKLSGYLPENGIFFEAGAFDGSTWSNTYFLERVKNWSGILVEPHPRNFRRCVKMRWRSKCFQGALVSAEYSGATIDLSSAGLMSITDQSELNITSHVQQGLKSQGIEHTERIIVPAFRIQEVIDQAGLPHIDFMSLDLEGAELLALSGMDHEKSAPSFLLIESRDHDATVESLNKHYRFVEELSKIDLLFAAKYPRAA